MSPLRSSRHGGLNTIVACPRPPGHPSTTVAPALLFGLLALLPAAGAGAQPARVGLLGPAEPRSDEIAAGLRAGLRDHGRTEDSTPVLVARVPRGDRAAARAATERLVRERAQVLFVIGSELVRLAREVTPDMPIVFLTPGDPVASGLVASLARPGGAMTGMTIEYPELSGKRLELLREIAPRARRILVIYDSRDASPRQAVQAAREAAASLGLVLVEREAPNAEEVRRALGTLASVDALLGIPGGVTAGSSGEIIKAANAAGRPTMFPGRTTATADALAIYGPSDVAIARQAARLVDKILAGSSAGDLPVERPTTLEFIVNMRTAKALGLTIPQSVLLRADQLIQ